MLLAVDIGNTNIVFGLIDAKGIHHSWRIGTDKTKTEDEYGVLLRNLFEYKTVNIPKLCGSVISCVVPALQDTLVKCVKDYFSIEPLVVGPGVKTGMQILYKNPQEVGADRIVNAIGAYEAYKTSLVIVDFGTATTFDCVSQKGEYLGGVITPGITISSEALFGSASKLPKVEIKKPENVIGKTTIQSIQSGLVYGYAGLVDGIVSRIKTELGAGTRVLATGGLAGLIAKESETIEQIDEHLALKGLWIIYERNR
ncbi:MAG: type III pantothenate kinase [Candidatus Dadabacteria bacterium]|nr:type III pantothenate kinase [Candidatus Dadabacteria bacterium]NIS08632.1 type III pantothenate kinase [Candidatus Dadabacteria bacterium]NIV42466.1 type III pantothenate kinase [Candidatus Dadabacteria bacterium]NIX15348.1 type III pantothenate kinase [Candidatus Dadabacteria bacterium]NIY22007.1 type III pantothenate kinase [Candidatus Dadabacteria bacterium]